MRNSDSGTDTRETVTPRVGRHIEAAHAIEPRFGEGDLNVVRDMGTTRARALVAIIDSLAAALDIAQQENAQCWRLINGREDAAQQARVREIQRAADSPRRSLSSEAEAGALVDSLITAKRVFGEGSDEFRAKRRKLIAALTGSSSSSQTET